MAATCRNKKFIGVLMASEGWCYVFRQRTGLSGLTLRPQARRTLRPTPTETQPPPLKSMHGHRKRPTHSHRPNEHTASLSPHSPTAPHKAKAETHPAPHTRPATKANLRQRRSRNATPRNHNKRLIAHAAAKSFGQKVKLFIFGQ
jgi:hypothetical protein